MQEGSWPVEKNVLVPVLGRVFFMCYNRRQLPRSWKEARLSPLYKKGPLLECKSYRMPAVSSVLYRLYANVVRQTVTD